MEVETLGDNLYGTIYYTERCSNIFVGKVFSGIQEDHRFKKDLLFEKEMDPI